MSPLRTLIVGIALIAALGLAACSPGAKAPIKLPIKLPQIGWGLPSHLNTVFGVTTPASRPIRLLAILKVEHGGIRRMQAEGALYL